MINTAQSIRSNTEFFKFIYIEYCDTSLIHLVPAGLIPTMLDRFKAAKYTLSSAFTSLSRTLFGRNMDTSVLPVHNQHVSVYIATLRLIGKTTGTKRLMSWKVVKLQRLKSKKISLHESMLAFVVGPDEKTCRILFERAGGELQASEGCSNLSPPPLRRSKSSISSASNSICPDLKAIDTVSLLDDNDSRSDDDVVGTITFTDDFPSLPDLALLAEIVHNAHPKYLLFSNNCYHFAGTMIMVLARLYTGHTSMDSAAGKWYGIDMQRSQNTSELCTLLEKAIETFVSCFLCRVIIY